MYLVAVSAILAFYLVTFFSVLSQALEKAYQEGLEGSSKLRWLRTSAVRCWAALFGGLLTSAPILQTLRYSLSHSTLDYPADITVAVSITGALGCLVWASAIYGVPWMRTQFSVRASGFAFLGYSAASLIVVIAGVVHLLLSHNGAAMLTSVAVKSAGISDVQCKADVLVAEWGDDRKADVAAAAMRPVKYRCPTGPIFNVWAETPFVPWPSYTTGESAKLARFLAGAQRTIDESEKRQ